MLKNVRCKICPNFLPKKKHKYCCNKCAREAETILTKKHALAKTSTKEK